jgi:hypothetical protein
MSASPPGLIGKAERLRALARNLRISSALSPTASQAPGYNVGHDAHGRPCPRLVEGTALAIALRKCADFGVCSLVRLAVLAWRSSVPGSDSVLCSRISAMRTSISWIRWAPAGPKLPEPRLASRPVADICPCPPSGRGRRRTGFFNLAREVGLIHGSMSDLARVELWLRHVRQVQAYNWDQV